MREFRNERDREGQMVKERGYNWYIHENDHIITNSNVWRRSVLHLFISLIDLGIIVISLALLLVVVCCCCCCLLLSTIQALKINKVNESTMCDDRSVRTEICQQVFQIKSFS